MGRGLPCRTAGKSIIDDKKCESADKPRNQKKNNLEGTPGYQNKLIFIHCKLLVKASGATFMFIGKFGYMFSPGQCWPCLSFSALRHGLKSLFLLLWTKAQAYCCDMNLCGGWVGKQGLNGSRQLLSQLRTMPLNSKVIS